MCVALKSVFSAMILYFVSPCVGPWLYVLAWSSVCFSWNAPPISCPGVFLSWFLLWLFSQMRFPIMIFVSTVITDALSYHDLWFCGSYRCVFVSWSVSPLFSQMHFPIMTFVLAVVTDAFSYRCLWFMLFSQMRFPIMIFGFCCSHRCVFLSWSLVYAVLACQMRFPIMIFGFCCSHRCVFLSLSLVSAVLADAFSYHDIWFLLFLQMRFKPRQRTSCFP